MASSRGARAVARSLERSLRRSASSTIYPSYSIVARPITRLFQHSQPANSINRSFSTALRLREEENAPNPSGIPPPRSYNYQEIHDIVTDPSPKQILIDVREPSELLATGRIPTAKSVPISSAPDAFFMSEEDFETKFGFQRPTEKDEVIFYCKAGVRSRQAALLAGQARPLFGGKVGNYNGSWLDWEKNGGKVEREGEQGEQSSVSGVTDPGQGRP